jgi:hypothetical protein
MKTPWLPPSCCPDIMTRIVKESGQPPNEGRKSPYNTENNGTIEGCHRFPLDF